MKNALILLTALLLAPLAALELPRADCPPLPADFARPADEPELVGLRRMLAEPHGDRAATLLWAESERSRFAQASADLHRRSEALAVLRDSADTRTPADWVDPLIDSHKSRWIFFSSASRPFGMVNLSPDTRTGGDWMNGYLYGDTKVRCFSHIHGWQLYGLAVLPVTGEMRGHLGMDTYASEFSHDDEVVRAGYHKLILRTYGVTAELTSTPRVGFHRYTFPSGRPAHVLFDTGATLMAPIASSEVRRVSDTELAGHAVMAPTPRRPKPFTVHFVAEFNQPFAQFGGWTNGAILSGQPALVSGPRVRAFATFAPPPRQAVSLKVALSYTSEAGARRNLAAELAHGDFDRVARESRDDWNQWLGRIEVADWLLRRSASYTNLWDARVRWMRPRRKDGSWLPNFTPAGTNAGKGFVEANSAIFTHFVPHDMPGLIRLFGGPDNYVAALNEQFEKAAPRRFLGEHGSHELAWVDYDNQPGAQMAHLFNVAGAPWLSQKWVREVKEETFGDATPHGGYNGGEDQGQMGALGVLMAIGLFDVQGGAALRPTYQITSPIFDRVTVHLDPRYFSGRTFTLVAQQFRCQPLHPIRETQRSCLGSMLVRAHGIGERRHVGARTRPRPQSTLGHRQPTHIRSVKPLNAELRDRRLLP